MLTVGMTNFSLVKYLVNQVLQNEDDRFDALRGHSFNVIVDDTGNLTVTSV